MLNIATRGTQISFEAEVAFVEPYVACVVGTTAGQVKKPAATSSVGQAIVGIVQESASAGQAIPVQLDGISKCVCYAAVAKGARVHVASINGRIDDSQDGTLAAVYLGIALEASSAGGEIISVLLNCPAVAEDGGAS